MLIDDSEFAGYNLCYLPIYKIKSSQYMRKNQWYVGSAFFDDYTIVYDAEGLYNTTGSSSGNFDDQYPVLQVGIAKKNQQNEALLQQYSDDQSYRISPPPPSPPTPTPAKSKLTTLEVILIVINILLIVGIIGYCFICRKHPPYKRDDDLIGHDNQMI